MIPINSLHTLQDIASCYYIDYNCNIININTGKILKPTLGNMEYYYVTLYDVYGRKKKVTIHKIVALAFIRNGEYEVINHKDGNKANNSPDNLEFCTQQENAIHAINMGLTPVKKYKVTFRENVFEYYDTDTMSSLANRWSIPNDSLRTIFKRGSSSRKYKIEKIEEV